MAEDKNISKKQQRKTVRAIKQAKIKTKEPTMTNSGRTAGPWHTERFGENTIYISAKKIHIAGMVRYGSEPLGKDGYEQANAEFIVLACNSHDDLVAALRKAIIMLEGVDCLQPLTIGDILGNESLLNATGINPWCVNEGLANSEDAYSLDMEISSLKQALKDAGEGEK